MKADEKQSADRRWTILQEIQNNNYASVAELSRLLNVSEVTIRRDLTILEEMGLIQRTHGAAQAVFRVGQTPPFEARLYQNMKFKRAIGIAAAAMIKPGDAVCLDAGTTVLETAKAIPQSILDDGKLTVVTRSLSIASVFRPHRRTRLILLGGMYVHDFDTFVGPQVEQALQNLHVNTLFIGIDGISIARGITTDNVMEAPLYPAMTRCADRIVVVTDSGKVGVNQLQAILSISQIHTFVTDDHVSAEFVSALREKGVEVIVAETDPSVSFSSLSAVSDTSRL